MLCIDCTEQFSAIIDDDVTSIARSNLDGHFASCNDCRTEFEHFRQALEALRTAPPLPAASDFTERVVGTVTQQMERAALLEHSTGVLETSPVPGSGDSGSVTTPHAPRPQIERSVNFRWMAAAAVLTIAFGATFYLRGLIIDLSEQAKVNRATVGGLDLEKLLKQHDLVIQEGRIVPNEFALGGDVGQVFYKGEWWDPDVLARELEYSFDPLTHMELVQLAEREMIAQGFEKINGRWIHRGDVAKYSDGFVETAPGVWTRVEELVERWHEEQGDVHMDDVWMSPRHLAKHQPSLALDPQLVGENPHAVTRMLQRMHLGAAVTYKSLTLYPLLALRQTDTTDLAMLHRAGPGVEMTETGNPFVVRVVNHGDEDVFFMPGDLLSGGAYDRVVTSAAILPAKSQPQFLDVCSAQSGVFREQKTYGPRSGHDLAPLLVRKALVSEFRQAAVWAAGGEYARLATAARTVSLTGLYDDPTLQGELCLYDREFYDMPSSNDETTVGVVIGVDDEIVSAEWFASNRLLRENFDRIVRAAALEALRQSGDGYWDSTYPNSVDGARAFLENVTRAGLEERDESGLAVLSYGELTLGTATIHAGRAGGDPYVAHVIIFDPTLDAIESAFAWARYETDPNQVALLLRTLRKQIASAGDESRRLDLFRELAAIRAPLVVSACAAFLRDPNPDIRVEAIGLLSLRPTPEALVGLLRFFDDLTKNDRLGLLSEVAMALARTGAEEAALRLVHAIEEADGALAAAVLPALPVAVYRAGRVALAKEAVEQIVAFWGSHRDDAEFESMSRMALSRLTGLEFLGVQDALGWLASTERQKTVWESWPNERRGHDTRDAIPKNPKDH